MLSDANCYRSAVLTRKLVCQSVRRRASRAKSSVSRADTNHDWKAQVGRFTFQAAENAAELRAVASQRVLAFWNEEKAQCSEFAAKLSQRAKVNATWEYLEDKLASEKDRFVCIYAWTDDIRSPEIVQEMREDMDLSSTLPADEGPAGVVIGSLDLNVGARLAGEQLAGNKPKLDPLGSPPLRAYLSNVAVSPQARRQGVAAALISAACEQAKALHVSHLYVHVAIDNTQALQLYRDKSRFMIVQEESSQTARLLNRPSRLLLEKMLLE